jgi:4-amino-4-deoxychorismate lyase
MREIQFVESIWLSHGEMPYLDLHIGRMRQTLLDLYKHSFDVDVNSILKTARTVTGEYKIRIIYDRHRIVDFDFNPYTRREIRSAKIVAIDDDVHYRYKYLERKALDQAFAKRQDCEEIIMVDNAGKIKDAYYYNLLFEGAEGQWYVPKSYMLPGVMLQSLLKSNLVQYRDIHVMDLPSFSALHFINALNPPGYQSIVINRIIP